MSQVGDKCYWGSSAAKRLHGSHLESILQSFAMSRSRATVKSENESRVSRRQIMELRVSAKLTKMALLF